MIPFIAMWIFILSVTAGYLLDAHPVWALGLLAYTAISAGCLTAYLQTERLPDDEDQ